MQASGVLGSRFMVDVTARPGVDLAKLEAAIDEELAKLRSKPLTDEELTRAKNQYETAFVARLESVRERASILNLYQAEVGDPGFADRDLERYRKATADGIRQFAERVLDPKARVILQVIPKKGGER